MIKVKKYFPFIMPASVTVLALWAMIRSTYLSGESSIVFLAGIAVSVLMLLLSMRLGSRAVLGTSFAAALSIGNLTALPILYYADSFDIQSVRAVANDALMCFILACFSFAAAWLIMFCVSRFYSTRLTLISLCIAVIGTLSAAAVFLLSDKGSGTTLVFGVQAAIPAAALLILTAAAAVTSEKKWLKILCTVVLVLLAGTLIIRNETGIPAEVFAALLLWYLFFAKQKKKLLTVFSIVLPVLTASGLLFLKFFGTRLSGIVLVDKVMDRLFNENVEQAVTAKKILSESGIFGSNSYTYLSEGTSDFCMVTLIHYLGIVFMLIILIATVPFFCRSASELMKEGGTFANTAASMSLCLLTVMLIYNLLMCCGLVPVIGVQAPFVGNSKLFSLLSGGLLGLSCFSEKESIKIYGKIKKIRSEVF